MRQIQRAGLLRFEATIEVIQGTERAASSAIFFGIAIDKKLDKVSRGLCGLKPLALQGSPGKITAKILPEALQPPDHVQLPVRKMLEEAVADEPNYISPVVVALVSNFFL